MDSPTFLELGVSGSSSLWSKIFVTFFFLKIEDLEISKSFRLSEVGFYSEYFHSLENIFTV